MNTDKLVLFTLLPQLVGADGVVTSVLNTYGFNTPDPWAFCFLKVYLYSGEVLQRSDMR